MALDPEIKKMLLVMAEMGILDPINDRPVDELRELMGRLAQVRGLGDGETEEADITISGPGGALSIRVYTPYGEEGLMPAIVYFHGGGFVLGNLDSHGHVCRALARDAASVVFSVDYRLAPEHPFPAAIDDAYAALQWVASNALEFNVDVEKIAVAGDSAGANLAAVSAIRARDNAGPKLCFQLLVYPPADVAHESISRAENANGYFLTREMINWFYKLYLSDGVDANHPWVSLLNADNLSNLPKTFVITAEYDPLRDEGEAFAKKLGEAGGSVDIVRFDGAIHGFFGPSTNLGRKALGLAVEHFRRAVGAI